MSKTKKKFKRQNRRQKFPWLPIALGGVLLITAVFFLARQDSNRGGTPSIIVDPQRIDYGDVKLGVNKTFSIKVTNAGDGTLRFMEEPYIQVLEGCWPPQLTIGSMVLKPGESTIVQSSVFMMHEGMDGPHKFAVHLKTNDANHPDLIVEVLSNWIP